MTGRAPRLLAAAVAVLAIALEAATLVLLAKNGSMSSLEDLGFNGVAITVVGATYPMVGWLLASRRPGNPIGWFFLVMGVSLAGTAFLHQYAVYGLVTAPGAVPLADVASWMAAWSWVPGFLALPMMILTFPDGRLPSRRWRPVLWLVAIAAFVLSVPVAVAAWYYRGPILLGLGDYDPSELRYVVYDLAQTIGGLLLLPIALAAVAAVVVRFRRSAAVERQQIKWFAAAGSVAITVMVASTFITLPFPANAVAAVFAVLLVPVATAVAVLRYRLYEIDRLISRGLAWAVLSGLLVAVYVAAVLLLQGMLAGVTQGQTLVVAASTLLAAALFQPLRGRIQRLMDRRFDRARYDGERTAAAFAQRLRDQTDMETVTDDLSRTAGATVAPQTLAIWLRRAGGAR